MSPCTFLHTGVKASTKVEFDLHTTDPGTRAMLHEPFPSQESVPLSCTPFYPFPQPLLLFLGLPQVELSALLGSPSSASPSHFSVVAHPISLAECGERESHGESASNMRWVVAHFTAQILKNVYCFSPCIPERPGVL